jgi:predicted lipid-binding transport protein (Tim44 family)
MIPILISIVLLVGVVLAVKMGMKRAAAQRVAHDARLRSLMQATLAAAKKKQAAEAAAAAAAAKAAPAIVDSPATTRDERDCPYCAEQILKKARVCKHCGRDVEPLA